MKEVIKKIRIKSKESNNIQVVFPEDIYSIGLNQSEAIKIAEYALDLMLKFEYDGCTNRCLYFRNRQILDEYNIQYELYEVDGDDYDDEESTIYYCINYNEVDLPSKVDENIMWDVTKHINICSALELENPLLINGREFIWSAYSENKNLPLEIQNKLNVLKEKIDLNADADYNHYDFDMKALIQNSQLEEAVDRMNKGGKFREDLLWIFIRNNIFKDLVQTALQFE